MIRVWARRLFILANVVGYWVILPFALSLTGWKLDRMFGFAPISYWLGIAIGSFLLLLSSATVMWSIVVLYLRGGGLPIALLAPTRLVQEGPYSISRHPLYVCFTFYVASWAGFARSTGFFALVLPGFILLWSLYAKLHEERVLLDRFDDEYTTYKQEVPFFFRLARPNKGPGILFSLLYVLAKPIVRILFPIVATGTKQLPRSGPAAIIANHVCYLDPVFLAAATGRYIRFVTTAEVMRSGFKKWLFTQLGSIPASRYRTDSRAIRSILAALKEKEMVGIFPEGERSWDGAPGPMEDTPLRLLAKANVPIIPIQIQGSYALYPRWARFPLPGPVKIKILPPVHATSLAQIRQTAEKLRSPSEGRTYIVRKAAGIERVLWACPSCLAVGSITTENRRISCNNCGTYWELNKKLMLQRADGSSTTIAELAEGLRRADLLQDVDKLAAIGTVDLLQGDNRLHRVASGNMSFKNSRLQVGDISTTIEDALVIRLEGNDRLDIGLRSGRRLRLRFHTDSPLKWKSFLSMKLRTPS